MQGQIIKIVSDLHIVSCEGETYPCKCRGIFRKEHITPLVGDYVLFSKEKCLIEEILPRKSEFQRPKVSNIDQAFLITSLKLPDFSLNLLDKFIVLMENSIYFVMINFFLLTMSICLWIRLLISGVQLRHLKSVSMIYI